MHRENRKGSFFIGSAGRFNGLILLLLAPAPAPKPKSSPPLPPPRWENYTRRIFVCGALFLSFPEKTPKIHPDFLGN